MQTYVRPNLVFTHGEGARMYDAAGKEYLDFAAGIAVNALGAPHNTLFIGVAAAKQGFRLAVVAPSRQCTMLLQLAAWLTCSVPEGLLLSSEERKDSYNLVLAADHGGWWHS